MRKLSYLSVCSGIEAATVAWHPLGWLPFGFAEIEPFPSAVLAHHYASNLPNEIWLPKHGVPNFGDIQSFKEWPDANIDVLVGGTPCQSFSIAGLRKLSEGSCDGKMRRALLSSQCPHPANSAPYDPNETTVEKCIARDECGCDNKEALAAAAPSPEKAEGER